MEDVWELQSPTANKLSLKTRAKIGVDMTLLLKTAMRFRPDRIIVGEVRDGAALALLKAMNTGHDGCMSTLHASSAKRGLIRLEQLIAEASLSPMRDVIAETINLVEGLHDGEFVTTPLE
jgi:Flp pilus assembly CpaF family ATPase